MNTSGLSTRCRYARRLRGWSRRRLSREAGLGSSFIGQLESGDIRRPSVESIEQIARALNCEPAWLAFGSGPAPELPEELRADSDDTAGAA